jgi:hypothetical protein
VTQTTEAALPLARRRALRAAAAATAMKDDAMAAWRRARITLGARDIARAHALQTTANASIHRALVSAFEVNVSIRGGKWIPPTIDIQATRRLPGFEVWRAVAACRHCGVAVVGRAADRRRMLKILAGHERFCPGGERHADVWRPFSEPVRRPRGRDRRLRLVASSSQA